MKKNDPLIIVLATLLTASLIFVTWAQIGISTWIVGHSGVEDLMLKDGEHTLFFLKDGFWFLGRGLLLVEAVFGGTLLWLLWVRLYRPPK